MAISSAMLFLPFLQEGIYFVFSVVDLPAYFFSPAELFAVLYLPEVSHADP
jgi:hypothetical protein